MKKKNKHFMLLLLMMLLGIPLQMRAEGDVLQLQFGKQTVTVASDEVVTFYDWMGTDDISSSSSNNSQSLTVFQPAVAGQSIQITFESCDVTNDGANWPGRVYVYSGNPDADGSFQWATSTSGVTANSTMPEGDLLATLDGSYTDLTYVSGAADGSLSVGMLWRFAKECKGWVAKVRCVTLENQTVTGAGSSYDGVVASPTSKQNVALANAYVTATGVMNPDNVTGIYFTMTQNEGMIDPTALRLFVGNTQVEASVEADGAGYKFVLNEAPVDGTKTFTIKGDILGTAAVGAKAQLDVTKVTTVGLPDGIVPFTAATSVVVENPALVIMSSAAQTVTVGETPMQFYDEGGKDGGIQANTNGQVTFLSGVEGKKVMVDFTVNNIWQGSFYNQELRIYSGQEVVAANLLRTLQQGETGSVRSTADDGSLTVVLYSDASGTTAADGFEATVSLFEPQPMDFDGIATVAASSETVCAGDDSQDMLTITVKAKDTEPAMQVTKMSFTAGETSALVTAASLYYGNNKVGDTAVENSVFDITLTTPQALVEGDNVFTLKYAISEDAQNDQKLSAQAVSVTALVNGVAKTETVAEAPVAERTVANIVLSHKDQGTVTKTVNGSLVFNTQTASSYSSYCEAGIDERINIFVPKHEGMKAQIDFSEFNVQYSSSPYGNKSTFKIYAGQGTSGDLLWELNSATQESAGPGEIIRSTAADGSLTIVFNPNSSYSYYFKGWKSAVSEYQTKDMEVISVEAAQATTADASIGATDLELITVNVVTEGDLNALSMSSLKLNMKGCETNLEKVSLWQGETKLAEAASAAEVTLTPAEAVMLAEGDNLFTVKADVSSDAVENQTIDAQLLTVSVGGNEVAAISGDPEGSRTLKNQVLMTEGDHGTMNLTLGKTVSIFDDGGADGDGADGVNATLTLAPAGEAECIKLTNQGITFSYTAHLYVYNGSEVNDENLIVDLTGSSAKFDPIVSDPTIDGGRITLRYVGAGSYTKPNFAVTAEGYKKSNLSISSVTTEDISVSEVLKGQTDVKMLKIAVEVKGDMESVDITSFNVTCTSNDAVEAQHVYQTDKASSFSANTEFADKYTITSEGTYYFWLCYDVKSTAEVGQYADATLSSIVANGETIDVTDPATAIIDVASGKSGDYIVAADGTGNYTTIQAAVDDLGTLGMEGAVTLKIKAGEYNEKVRVPYIKGMGSVNTLTIESESGQRDVKIYHDQYTTAGYSDDQHKKDYGVVTLYEASYVTLRNLEITTADATGYKALVMVKDGSRHNTIDNCYLHADIVYATSGDGVALVNHTIIDEENMNNDYLTVRNCLLEGGKYGVYMGGTSTVALPKEVGGVVEGNTFKNNGRFMMYSYDELGAKIRNNTFIIDNSNVKMSNGVIDINVRDEYEESTEITGNIFNLASANTVAAIYIRQMEATATAPAIIANNVVNLTSANASCTPLKISSGKVKNMNIAHNTFRTTGENGGASFWASSTLSEGYGNVNVVNNIIQNETAGYAVNLYNDNNLGTEKYNFQNNVVYTDGETFFRAAAATTGDFDLFVEKTGATGLLNQKVTFVSDEILQPENNLEGQLYSQLKLDYVPTDISGRLRADQPTMGAYEYSDADEMPAMAEGYPAIVADHEKATITFKADADGKAYLIVRTAEEDAPVATDFTVTEGENVPVVLTLSLGQEAAAVVEGLNESTDYVAYYMLQSARGSYGEVMNMPFQTQAKPIVYNDPVVMAVDEEWSPIEADLTIEAGESITLNALVGDGKAPFTVQWMNGLHQPIGEATVFDDIETAGSTLVSVTVTPTECDDYTAVLTDDRGKTAEAKVRVIVTGEARTATFENLYLEPESYNYGEEDPEGELTTGSFVSGSYRFDTANWPEYYYWYNFAYSNRTATTFEQLTPDQFNSSVGSGYDGSSNYVVSFPQGGNVTVMNNPEGDQLRGFYVSNTAYTLFSILNGDGYGDKFAQGDWLKLTIKADNGNTVDYMLADYQSENEADHYALDTWQWVDLRQLGTVKSLTFTLTGSDVGDWGLNTPAYFCMDNFNGERDIQDVARQTTQGSIELSTFFAFDDPTATVVYTIDDELEEGVEAFIEGSQLVITSHESREFDVVVKAVQRGRVQFVRIPVAYDYIPTGISAAEAKILQDAEAVYDAAGRATGKANRLSRGVNIVRQKDGNVKKISVK